MALSVSGSQLFVNVVAVARVRCVAAVMRQRFSALVFSMKRENNLFRHSLEERIEVRKSRRNQ